MCRFLLTRREGLVSFTISAQLEIGTEHLRSSFPPEIRTFPVNWSSFLLLTAAGVSITLLSLQYLCSTSCSPSLGGGMVGGGSVVGGSVGA